jgi:muramoyltetrapeptide carboxypeptidase
MKNETITPEPLKAGDKVGIAAPAGPFEIERFEKGLAVIGAMGFVPVVDDDVYKRDRHLAGPDQHRARHLNRLFANDEIQAIICARGGFGCLRVLPYLDYDLIRAHPKTLIGFSDVTALLVTLVQRCGLAGLHGPVVTSLGFADEASRARFKQALTGDAPADLAPVDPVVIRAGRARGVLTGGNLATLCHLVGTDFTPDFSGKIVLLEDVNEAPYRIDRMLTQMRLAGCFENMAGLVLGSFKDCGANAEVRAVIEDVCADFKGPILGGFEIGHGQTNMAVSVGVNVEVDTDRGGVKFF